jgi:hypothetical protein
MIIAHGTKVQGAVPLVKTSNMIKLHLNRIWPAYRRDRHHGETYTVIPFV